MGVAVSKMTGLGVRDDASRHSAGNLTNGNLHFRRRLDDHQRTLVLGARLRQPGAFVTSFLVLGNEDVAFDRIPVGMYVKGRHENRHLQFTLVEIFVLVGRFYHYDASVRRRDDEVGVIYLQHPHRVAEEIGDEHE